uniref:hypothetical protein n=1 Tax=Castellaniella defragrans TaxID=75697 RepID=UPI00334218F3
MTTKTEITQERAAFEAWAKKRGASLHRVTPCDGSDPYYEDGWGAAAWAAWQARAAVEAERQDTAELLRNPVHVHANMCRGIIAPITFDMLAHILGDEATNKWLAERERRMPSDDEILEAVIRFANARAAITEARCENMPDERRRLTAEDCAQAYADLTALLSRYGRPAIPSKSTELNPAIPSNSGELERGAGPEPVGVIGDDFGLYWVGQGPIAPIIERNGLKVGDKLYAAPVAAQARQEIGGVTLDGCLETLFRVGEYLGIDYAASRNAPEAPSGVYIQAIEDRVAAQTQPDLIRFDFINADGQQDSKMLTHDEMRSRYSDICAAPVAAFVQPSGNPGELAREAFEKWQPIDTAPKDGTEVLLRGKKGQIANGYVNDVGRRVWPYIRCEPVEWMPIPQDRAQPVSAADELPKGDILDSKQRILDAAHIWADTRIQGLTPAKTEWSNLALRVQAELNFVWSLGREYSEETAQDREDAEHPEWMNDDSRAPWAINSLKTRISEMRTSEKRCRNAFRKDYMRVVSAYFADALAEAATAFEKRLAAIDAARAKGE